MFLLGPKKFSRTVVRDVPTFIAMPTYIEIKFSSLELSVKKVLEILDPPIKRIKYISLSCGLINFQIFKKRGA